ncbi:uncharacterized protein LOC115382079 [Salarias fasciatus]|uniref:uncharacterized protein LOC115382079 n=1 Tax=Salarias fasciatus TaxID=181472 RepID=UPI001176BC1D|nr:uncharacterized protein LOC115382079 [Salarias fasciatus]
MDRSRMDAEGARAVQPNRRISKLAVVVAVQNLLLVVCLLVTFYVYRDFQANKADFLTEISENIVHIQLSPIRPLSHNGTVNFTAITSSYLMDLKSNKRDISIKCTGFYIWLVQICCASRKETATGTGTATGTVQLKVTGSETPVSSFTLDVAKDDCRGLHSIIYLKKNQQASVNLVVQKEFQINKMSVEMNSLSGKKCDD